ncbi:hypothetical protein D3C81_885450 [compost metagenome]
MHRGGFAGHHVRIELRRTAHGLAGVVDDEIQPRTRGQQLIAERLHAGRVAQIQSVHLQTMTPNGEVGFFRITCRRVTRETRGDDQFRTGTQQLQPRLVADLDATTSEQRHAPAQVCSLGALDVVQIGADRAHLIVEMMQLGELLLADIAVTQLGRMHRFSRSGGTFAVVRVMQPRCVRREIVRRAEHRLATQGADAGLFEQRLGFAHFLLVTLTRLLLEHLPPRLGLGVIDLRDYLVQTHTVSFGQRIEHAAIGFDGFQQIQRIAQAVGQGQGVGKGCGDGVQFGSGKSGGRPWMDSRAMTAQCGSML